MQNNNQEAYVALSLDKKTLTFYYDEQRKSRLEKTWGIDERIIEDEVELCAWTGTGDVPNTTITAAEFDASFKNFCPTTTANWFYQLMRLKTIRGWRYLNTSKVEDMNSMFAGCSSLTTLNLSHFDTSNVTDMSYMFVGCISLKKLDLSRFDTSKVEDMSYLFDACRSLTSLDLSQLNTANVITMEGMFYGCHALTALDLSGFDTSKVEDMDSIFSFCTHLAELNLSHFNTSKVMHMKEMFVCCTSLTTLNLSGFDTSMVDDMYQIFCGCNSLTTIYGNSSWNCENSESMFAGCTSLRGAVPYDDSKTDASMANPETGYFTSRH